MILNSKVSKELRKRLKIIPKMINNKVIWITNKLFLFENYKIMINKMRVWVKNQAESLSKVEFI